MPMGRTRSIGLAAILLGWASLGVWCTTYGSEDDVLGPADAGDGPDAADAGDLLGDATDLLGDATDARPTSCDEDGDGFERIECVLDAGRDAAEADCDDTQPAIHPGQTFRSDTWPDGSTHRPVGDWDCDGTTTKQFAVNVACSGPCSTFSAVGFSGDPACGADGPFVTGCALLCNPILESRRQTCR